jgi:predicted transcriptional regulator of viral defense system
MKSEKTALGPLEMQFLAYVQLKKKQAVRTGETGPALGLSAKQERELLSRLSRSGMIIRLKRGAYLVPPRVPAGGRWSVSPYFVLAELMAVMKAGYQISGPSAFYYYGFEGQVPSKIFVYNDRIYGARRIGGAEFAFTKVATSRLGASRALEIPDGGRTIMVSKARALVDAVYDWPRYDTIPRAYAWIAAEVEKEPGFGVELARVAARFGNRGARRRLGYVLELCGLPETLLAGLKRGLGSSRSLIPWVPGKPGRGTVNRDWGLIVNDTLPAPGP